MRPAEDFGRLDSASSDERGEGSERVLAEEEAGFFEPVKNETIFCQNVGAGARLLLARRSPEGRPERPSDRRLEPRREPWADWVGE